MYDRMEILREKYEWEDYLDTLDEEDVEEIESTKNRIDELNSILEEV